MKFTIVVLGVFLPAVLCAQHIRGTTAQAILKAQDLRDTRTLSTFLWDTNPGIRERAAFACGSVQDTSHIERLLQLLSDKKRTVRMAVAFALGQLNFVVDSTRRSRISRSLVERLNVESNQASLLRIVEALGKIGNESSLDSLVLAGERSQSNEVKSEVALSVGRYAYRGIKDSAATAYAVNLLLPSFGGEHWKPAYALMRIASPGLLSRHEEQIVGSAFHEDPRVRMFIASALGRMIAAPSAANALLSLSRSDSDWRVRVNAIRSLGKADSAFQLQAIPALLGITADSNVHVSVAAFSTLGEMKLKGSSFAAETRKVLVEVIELPSYSEPQKREAAIALGRIFGVDAYPVLADQYRKGHLTKNNYIAALAYTPTQDAAEDLIRLNNEGDYRTQREALESLLGCIKLAVEKSPMIEIARPVFIARLQSADMAVITVAASALADSLLLDGRSEIPLITSLRRLTSSGYAEAMIAIIQALGELQSKSAIGPLESRLMDGDINVAMESASALSKITGRSYTDVVRRSAIPAHTAFDWRLLDWTRKYPVVQVKTSRGSFTFKLLPDEAPFTTINLVSLIRNGFFNRLSFHRVVPNFVVQGGDPRGDGWGGPGYTQRSEFGYEHYERGTLGVASSGKDTEGCQWFVTHCDTPHLDGRYTIFGKIIAGMDVVDKIQIGDYFERMTLQR